MREEVGVEVERDIEEEVEEGEGRGEKLIVAMRCAGSYRMRTEKYFDEPWVYLILGLGGSTPGKQEGLGRGSMKGRAIEGSLASSLKRLQRNGQGFGQLFCGTFLWEWQRRSRRADFPNCQVQPT